MDSIPERFSRTANLISAEAVNKLTASRVILFGVGGVGSFCAEALARAGVGCITLVDPDVVSESNLNRQLIALTSTIGRNKAELMAERISDINPDADVSAVKLFYLPENADEIDITQYDIVIDAIDTVTAKLELAVRAFNSGIPIISAMGTGNKLRPDMFEVTDIFKTSVCPLARVMRNELKKRGVTSLRVIYSREEPVVTESVDNNTGKRVPASISYVPSSAGLLLASEAIKILLSHF